MAVSDVKDVRWPDDLLDYCRLLTPKERSSRSGYVLTKKDELPLCLPYRPVTSYVHLQELVSMLAALNGHYMLFLRGQRKQYFQDNKTRIISEKNVFRTHSLKPNLWREEDEDRRREKMKRLLITTDVLRRKITTRNGFESAIVESIRGNPLTAWAIIQHYSDVLGDVSPMLDVTRSLHVACHFALEEDARGYIYVLGFPWPTERFYTSIDDGLVMASLLGATPYSARRPLAQDGYLACTSDYWKILARGDDNTITTMEGQFHRRILAVIEVRNEGGFWWGSSTDPSKNQYSPADDAFYNFLHNKVAPEVERKLRMKASRTM